MEEETKNSRKSFAAMHVQSRYAKLAVFTSLFLVMMLFNVALAMAQVQSHRLSETRVIDKNLDMGSYQVNTSRLNATTGYFTGSVGIGAVSPSQKLHVQGGMVLGNSSGAPAALPSDIGMYGSGSFVGVVGNASGTGHLDMVADAGVFGTGASYGVYGQVDENNYGYIASGSIGVFGLGSMYGIYGMGAPGAAAAGYFQGNVTVTGNVSFDGEIMPDGALCAAGQILKKAAANDWDCASDDTLGGGAVTGGGASGRVALWNGTSSVNSSSGLVWDFVNSRLGVGAASPVSMLHVQGGDVVVNNSAGSPGLAGAAVSALGGNFGVFANGSNTGLYGIGGSTGSGVVGYYGTDVSSIRGQLATQDYGVYGQHDSAYFGYVGGSSIGVLGNASGSGSVVSGVGVFGTGSSHAGYFAGNVTITGNVSFDGEIMPDGALCSNGQILKKTADNDWDCVADSIGTINGGGAANNLSKWVDADTLGNSSVYETAAGNVGIGTSNPNSLLHVQSGRIIVNNSVIGGSDLSTATVNALGGNYGIYANGSVYGVLGEGNIGLLGNGTAVGVRGRINASVYGDLGKEGGEGLVAFGNTYGVRILVTGSNPGIGVHATGYVGVVGNASSDGALPSGNIGVFGAGNTFGGYFSNPDTTGTDIGVFGNASGSGQVVDGAGVFGTGSTYGLYGDSSTYGVYGSSSMGTGVYGATDSNNFGYLGSATTGVYGQGQTYGGRFANTDTAAGSDYAVYATTTGAGTWNYGGYFDASGATNNAGLVGNASGSGSIVNGAGVFGTGSAYGVYGRNDSDTYGWLGGIDSTADNLYHGVYGQYDNDTYGFIGGASRAIEGYGEQNVYGGIGYVAGTVGTGVYGYAQNSSNTINLGMYGFASSGSSINAGVVGNASGSGPLVDGAGVFGTGSEYGGYFTSEDIAGKIGVAGNASGSGPSGVGGVGVLGTGINYGVYGYGSTYGVQGRYDSNNYGYLGSLTTGVYGIGTTYGGNFVNADTSAGVDYAVSGSATGAGTWNYGGYFTASGATGNTGVVGNASGSGAIVSGVGVFGTGNPYAGYFAGNVTVTGNVTVGTGTVFIDGTNSRLGIGTANPAADLHVVGSPTLGEVIIAPAETGSGDDAALLLCEDDVCTFGFNMTYNGGTNDMYVSGFSSGVNYGPHVSIGRDDGLVGIGMINPDASLHINGSVCVDDDNVCTAPSGGSMHIQNNLTVEDNINVNNRILGDSMSYINIGGCGPTATNCIGNSHSGEEHLDSDNDLYVEGTVEFDQNFYMDSLIAIGGGTEYNVYWAGTAHNFYYGSSSQRYKENISDLDVDVKGILALQPRSFNWKGSGDPSFGYIAEEVDALGLTEFVGYDNESRPDTVYYEKIPIYMLEILKEHEDTIRAQQEEIYGLKQLVCLDHPDADVCKQ